MSDVHTQRVTATTLTRGQMMARGVVTAGTLAAGGILIGGLPKLAVSQPSQAQDARVLEWLLQVEYLEAGFYSEAERRGALNGEPRVVRSRSESTSARTWTPSSERWGPRQRQAPTFDFGDAVTDPRQVRRNSDRVGGDGAGSIQRAGAEPDRGNGCSWP